MTAYAMRSSDWTSDVCSSDLVTLLVKKRNWLLGGLTLLLSAAFLVYYPVAIYFLAGLGIRVLYDRGIVARRELSWPLEAAAFLSCVYFGSSGWFAYTQIGRAHV